MIERANADFESSRKEFCAFVSRRSKGKKNIASLKNESGISVTSTRGKLQILQSHYERLGKVKVKGVTLIMIGRRKLRIE